MSKVIYEFTVEGEVVRLPEEAEILHVWFDLEGGHLRLSAMFNHGSPATNSYVDRKIKRYSVGFKIEEPKKLRFLGAVDTNIYGFEYIFEVVED